MTQFADAIQELANKAGSRTALAKSSGIRLSQFNRLISRNISLTLKLATRLELISGQPAKEWMHMFVDHLFDG